MRRTLLALAAILAAGEACSQSAPLKITVTLVLGDAAADVSDGAQAEVGMARCCVLATDAGVNLSDQCSLAAHGVTGPDAAALGLSEPCLSGNSGGTYGLWTCGAEADASQIQCRDNGLSCSLGDPCTLVDVGCSGVVQACVFTPYTPPPG
jgi:hypothetical protein